MAANNVRKLLQVSEEAAPLVQIPIMVGNEMFVLTQQDVRRTEDIRYLSYTRIMPNGHMFPTAAAPAADPVNYFGGLVTPLALAYATPPSCALQDLFVPKKPMEDDKPAPRNVADVSTQLAWSKQVEIEPSNHTTLRYSAATSTSNLTKNCGCQHEPPKSRNQHTSCHSQVGRNACCQTRSTTSSIYLQPAPRSVADASTEPSNPTCSPNSAATSTSNLTKNCGCQHEPPELRCQHTSCHFQVGRNACCQTRSSIADMSDAESQSKHSTANGSVKASKDKQSTANVFVKLSKYPSRHDNEQQTCTYTDVPRRHPYSFSPQKQSRYADYQSHLQSEDYAHDQSSGCPQYQTGTSPQNQFRATGQDPTQDQLFFCSQDQSSGYPLEQAVDQQSSSQKDKANSCPCRHQAVATASKGVRCVHFSEQEDDDSSSVRQNQTDQSQDSE
ncbi:uncharacterized protein LOC111068401 [Drosophila obscura]|uniref:uncharacterized protein LOC111068401 n=1 Tax=Drosophila obscura TaxID=7282 RepID=UPI001BB1FE24|nr:uncharacterized protein LOC111068401 [Drosophila obscura]